MKIQARNRRRLPNTSGSRYVIQPVSTWSSSPGSQSATGIVGAPLPNPSCSSAKRRSVGYAMSTPRRRRSLPTLLSRTRWPRWPAMNSRCASQTAHPSPRGRPIAGCVAAITAATSSSSSAPVPCAGSTPRARAAARYRRTVFTSKPSCSAIRFFGTPSNHSLRISLTSSIVTSRNAIPASRPWTGAGWQSGHADGGGNTSAKPSGPRGEHFCKTHAAGVPTF